jgi:hypothetical protein
MTPPALLRPDVSDDYMNPPQRKYAKLMASPAILSAPFIIGAETARIPALATTKQI